MSSAGVVRGRRISWSATRQAASVHATKTRADITHLFNGHCKQEVQKEVGGYAVRRRVEVYHGGSHHRYPRVLPFGLGYEEVVGRATKKKKCVTYL